MTRISLSAAPVLVCVALAPQAARADLTAPVAWVSAKKGLDIAICGDASSLPCRTFQYAHDNSVAAGGEIRVLDPGGYGPLTISKSISIVNDGVGVAGISVGGAGTGIRVQAGATDKVFIKGLTLDGANGAGRYGIEVFSAGNFTLTNCTIKGFAELSNGHGIWIKTNTDLRFSITDSIISGNFEGLNVNNIGGPTRAAKGVISRIEPVNNYYGITFGSTSNSVMNELNVSNGGPSLMKSLGAVYMTRSVLTGGGYGVISFMGGVLHSFGDNVIDNRGNDVDGPTVLESFK
jgi:hypothetical protein